ncbi:glycerate kinase type-2 family protein [Pelagibacterium xiamenense]|uniref:glycerate kinase type-2 family protein n=1 Tax=Pelagibacterium xiamenense TaxID=2901140 RepID=UPI001E653672|nr:glycerate kinase [Pelagibacterium xiamenense]MCD7061025.1 glycerate kinase [Pelagibacterium xiamenense]
MAWTDADARKVLREMFDAAIASAEAGRAVQYNLPSKPVGRCIVVGAGKASAAMAAGLEAAWPDVDMSGVVVTRYGHGAPTKRIKVLEASHPVPDENSLNAASAILEAVQNLTPDDLVIALISGGGSSLLVQPANGLTLEDKQTINEELLKSGAAINEINCVRAALSNIKGGKLALAAAPARIETLVISDVPGDTPSEVASGPTIPVPDLNARARAVIERYDIPLPPAAKSLIDGSGQTQLANTGKVRLIASPRQAIAAAQSVAHSYGLATLSLGDALEGESRELGKILAGVAASIRSSGAPVAAPCVVLSGGETTVTIAGTAPGKGGRNTEFLLSLAIALKGTANVWAIAGDTDGIDGVEDAAGAIVAPDTLQRARLQDLSADAFLKRHDSYSFFKPLNDLVITGPTLTNVNDFRAILIA